MATNNSLDKNTPLRPLPELYQKIIADALPGSRVVRHEWEPEPWMPFMVRVRVVDKDGTEQSLDLRYDVRLTAELHPDRAFPGVRTRDVHTALERLGVSVPRLLSGPVPDSTKPGGGDVTLAYTPKGENLLLWSLGENMPYRIRAATTLAFEAIDQLHGLTDSLLADPVGKLLPHRSLSVELAEIEEKGGPWLQNLTFREALTKAQAAAREIQTPLVYTNDLYFPNFLRVENGQVSEFVWPWGYLGDPLLGLAKFWTTDCYPFVHTGFVERYLYEQGISRREFAPRLATRTLWTLQRELPVTRPETGDEYGDALMALLDQALQDL